MSEEIRGEVRRLYRNRGWGAIKIARELRLHFKAAGNEAEAPSERAVGRELEKAKKVSEAEWRRYDEVAWPDSFGTADLPWASAAAILELTRVLSRPPLLPLARWYWRTLQAFPSANVATLHNIAAQLALAEDDDSARRAIGEAAVAGNLGDLESLGPFDPDNPEEIERAIHRTEIVLGALSPFFRKGLREVVDGSFRKGLEDESQG